MEKNINLIIQKITGLTKGQLFLNPKIDQKFNKEIDDSINRLKHWEPIEYIINNAEFYSLDFFIDNRVLIPRNDTEVMVDRAIESIIKYKKNITLMDVWTWSSCIAISILKNTDLVDNTYVTDISKKALEVSKINIEMYDFWGRIKQIEWDLIKPLLTSPSQGRNSYKLNTNLVITANLPYIKNNDFWNMDKETIKYEPDTALYWWKKTGFELYEKLINQCIELKKKYDLNSIILFIEIGFDQKEICENYINKIWLKYEIFKDNSDIERCVKIEF